ncbi:NADPH-dependent glutamate synthase [Heliorestis acidaminivorans]|uniref:NADPH-dependent glutamate synthase n=1 Tax=Heliorestis acidaminivorans TaxID=553427 RepID=A0A6I0F3L0_9FIRM|nr:NADPH-dependent glutamate synthase [Heliorestis acidaminivorans]KAB2951720.1 NADPH-dependent glutamate synthase [Heliorestis acidaminivorans]
MPCQAPQERVSNFNEVALGYTEEQAIIEAKRCLQCKKPKCRDGCPVEVLIPEFIQAVADGDMATAAKQLKLKNALPAVCGRVCPQESQCESKCIVGIKSEPVAIGRLERFVADWEMAKEEAEEAKVADLDTVDGDQESESSATASPKKQKVAIIGAGPAGLSCAADLARFGYDVTVFEALHVAGGVLMYGIPEFRLPKAIVEKEIDSLRKLGVNLQVNMVGGKTFTVEDLQQKGYEAVFIGTGAGLPNFMGIPGENLCGVFAANEFLTRTNLMKGYDFPNFLTPVISGRKVAVLGAGNVAMDAARTALRLGAEEVSIVYRRSEKEMPARAEEIEHAHEEGVQFKVLTNPVEIVGDEQGWVKGMNCLRYELGEPDESGRRRPVPVEGSEFFMEVDSVIVAIGQGPNPLVTQSTAGLALNRKGTIQADEEGRTSLPGVFAGGDIVTGAATVILAMGAGKKSARAIDQYLQSKQS